VKFSKLVRILEKNGFSIFKEKGSIRYYSKPNFNKLIRVTIMVQKKFLLVLVILF